MNFGLDSENGPVPDPGLRVKRLAGTEFIWLTVTSSTRPQGLPLASEILGSAHVTPGSHLREVARRSLENVRHVTFENFIYPCGCLSMNRAGAPPLVRECQ